MKIIILITSLLSITHLAFAKVTQPTDSSHPGSSSCLSSTAKEESLKFKNRVSKVYLPVLENQKIPLVVFGHGQALNEKHYKKTFEQLNCKGIAVLHPKYDKGFFDTKWTRMADDFNEIVKQTLAQYPQIDPDHIVYSGHSKGAYVSLMAAGSAGRPSIGSVVLFAPAGYDPNLITTIDNDTVVTLIWGEKDTVIKKESVVEIYDRLKVDHKQFIEAVSLPKSDADHFFPMTKSSFAGGKTGTNGLHYYGSWKWLVSSVRDLYNQNQPQDSFIYGEETKSTGVKGLDHKVIKNWKTKKEFLLKLKKKKTGTFNLPTDSQAEDIGHNWLKVFINKEQQSEIRSQTEVLHLTPNRKLNSLNLPNDFKESLWSLKNPLGFDVNAEKAWKISTGSRDVVVAVIDSGISLSHKDLKENIWINNAEANGKNNIDDDGNGYVDDINGYNFATNRPDPSDTRGHGTMVSGLIGATANNNYGIIGMAWDVQLMPLNMFPNLWGSASLDSALKAIDYAVANGAQIINASWGQAVKNMEPNEDFIILQEAIERANKKGILFVAAAGNSGSNNDLTGMVPATLDSTNILSVGAMNNKGQLWKKSNFGESRVDIIAPGKDILTTHKNYQTKIDSGTSLSAPIVSGIAALMLSVSPNLTPQEIIKIMINSCTPHQELVAKSRCNGYIDAARALELSLLK